MSEKISEMIERVIREKDEKLEKIIAECEARLEELGIEVVEEPYVLCLSS